MGLGYLTLARKSGECSVGIVNGTNLFENPEEILLVRYSEINGRNKLKVCHSGISYYFTRYGGKNDEKRIEDYDSMKKIFSRIKDILNTAPDYPSLELLNGQCFAAHKKSDKFLEPSSVAIIGIIPISQYQQVKIDVWGKDYRVVLPKDLKADDVQDIKLKILIQERLKSSGLEKVLKF